MSTLLPKGRQISFSIATIGTGLSRDPGFISFPFLHKKTSSGSTVFSLALIVFIFFHIFQELEAAEILLRGRGPDPL
jgi:hypothetical protein